MSSSDKKIKELENEIRRMQKENEKTFSDTSAGLPSRPKKTRNELLEFFIGLILLGVGLFWLFQRTSVQTFGIFGGAGIALGNFLSPTGAVIIPLVIGIILLFFLDNRIVGWVVTVLGLAIIVLAIILSVRINFERTSMFDFILMFGFMAAGSGLLLRVLFRKRDNT